MKITTELEAAIEGLYRAFESYSKPDYTNPCLHCHTKEEERNVHARPLRQLTTGDLEKYAMDALYTWGSETEFKHFLPRLFELLVITEDPMLDFIDPELLFRKLPYASWGTWPDPEREAILRFARALWRAVIASTPEELEASGGVESWMCSIAQFEESLDVYLDDWIEDETESAYRMLAHFVLQEYPFSSRKVPSMWGERKEQWMYFLNWFRSPAVLRKLERGVDRWSGEELGDLLYETALLVQ